MASKRSSSRTPTGTIGKKETKARGTSRGNGIRTSARGTPGFATRMEKALDDFGKINVVVVGDLMIDEYIWGKCTRISPEAPVPVVEVERKTYRPGGAANVAANVAALGANVELAGLVGKDMNGEILVETLERENIGTGGIVFSESRPTTIKSRIIAFNQQIARTDIEVRSDIVGSVLEDSVEAILRISDGADVLVLSDYAKGFLARELIERVLPVFRARGTKTLVDPKIRNFFNYKGASLLKPNMKEVLEVLGMEFDTEAAFRDSAHALVEDLEIDALLVTRGEDGMSLFLSDGTHSGIATSARTVYDVTGAGDTVLGALACALGAGADFYDASIVANHAAGVVVGKLGTATVGREELLSAIRT